MTEPEEHSDSAILGIFAGLGIGIAGWVGSALLVVVLLNGNDQGGNHLSWLLAIPYLVPPAAIAYFGITARRNKKPRFAAGFYIAAAVLVLLEASCATYFWRS